MPSAEHGDAQSALFSLLKAPFQRKPGQGGPGGWWILSETEVELARHEVYVADAVGWRRERVPERPTGRPIRERPDWWCEVLSVSNARRDLVDKFRSLQTHGVPHYWLVDPDRQTLTVHRWTTEGFLTVLVATKGDRVRAEPFDALEIDVGLLFGDDPT